MSSCTRGTIDRLGVHHVVQLRSELVESWKQKSQSGRVFFYVYCLLCYCTTLSYVTAMYPIPKQGSVKSVSMCLFERGAVAHTVVVPPACPSVEGLAPHRQSRKKLAPFITTVSKRCSFMIPRSWRAASIATSTQNKQEGYTRIFDLSAGDFVMMGLVAE